MTTSSDLPAPSGAPPKEETPVSRKQAEDITVAPTPTAAEPVAATTVTDAAPRADGLEKAEVQSVESGSAGTPATATAAPKAPSTATATSVTEAPPTATSTAATTLADAHDEVNPPDFQGEVMTNNDLPTLETLRKIETYTVLDRDGKSVPFKSLYAGRNVARRMLIIFIRHFFCGNCQEYLRTLAKSITPEGLLQLPVPTFIAVVGCGTPELINSYIKETDCQFPVYADPTRRLYTELGMVRTLSMGSRPAYMQGKSLAQTVLSGVVQGLKHVKDGLVTKMGDQRQVGGEFLFEPASMSFADPIATPDEDKKPMGEDDLLNTNGSEKVEEKRVTWCHRMRSTRDHVEIPELMEVLGLEGDGTPIKENKRWSKALSSRKGTGLSMASQMSRMSVDGAALNGNGNGNGNGNSNGSIEKVTV